jgi:hypothetical protein
LQLCLGEAGGLEQFGARDPAIHRPAAARLGPRCLQLGTALSSGPAPAWRKQSGPQIQHDSFNKYDFSFYIWI